METSCRPTTIRERGRLRTPAESPVGGLQHPGGGLSR